MQMKKHIGSFLKFLLVAFLISMGMLFLLAYLLYRFRLSATIVAAGITAVYVIANFLTGFLAGKTKGQRKYLWGLGLGGAYFAVLFAVSVLSGRSPMEDMGNFMLTMFLCPASGMLGGMLS